MVCIVFRTIKVAIQLNLFVKIIPTVDSFILWLQFTLEVQRFCQKLVIILSNWMYVMPYCILYHLYEMLKDCGHYRIKTTAQ